MINAEQIHAGYIQGAMQTNSLLLKAGTGITPVIYIRPVDGLEDGTEDFSITPVPNSKTTLEFSCNDLLSPANLKCGKVNGYSIPGDFASAYHSHPGYVQNSGGQSLKLQVFNGKLEVLDANSNVIGTLTFD